MSARTYAEVWFSLPMPQRSDSFFSPRGSGFLRLPLASFGFTFHPEWRGFCEAHVVCSEKSPQDPLHHWGADEPVDWVGFHRSHRFPLRVHCFVFHQDVGFFNETPGHFWGRPPLRRPKKKKKRRAGPRSAPGGYSYLDTIRLKATRAYLSWFQFQPLGTGFESGSKWTGGATHGLELLEVRFFPGSWGTPDLTLKSNRVFPLKKLKKSHRASFV